MSFKEINTVYISNIGRSHVTLHFLMYFDRLYYFFLTNICSWVHIIFYHVIIFLSFCFKVLLKNN